MHVECHAGDRSAAGPVQKLEAAEMLLDDLLDDREAQPRSAHAGGDIGPGDAVPLAGKAEAVVHHRDDKPDGFLLYRGLPQAVSAHPKIAGETGRDTEWLYE